MEEKEKEKKTKPYKLPPTEQGIIEEPFVMYGTLNLDESKLHVCGLFDLVG